MAPKTVPELVEREADTRAPGIAGKVGAFMLHNAPLTGLVVLVVISTAISPNFLTEQNIFNVFRQWAMVGLIAVGLTFVIMSGGIDLSGGSILALATIVGALLVPRIGIGLAIAAVLLVGWMSGFLNGVFITWGRVPPFVATLGMLTMARGLALVLGDGRTIAVELPPAFRFWFGTGYLGPVPAPVVLTAVVFAFAAFVLRMTRFGRTVALVGDSVTAAHRCGIRVESVQRSVYALHGLLAAFAGLLFIGRLGVGEPTAGMLYELSGIAAVVIGGTPFTGGTGGVGLTVIGLLVIGVTYNILNLLSVSPYAQDIARGVIIVIAVTFSIRRLRASR
jgi:ribose/xylose/arabinose/galactoside ABC-type transport system permease subunit